MKKAISILFGVAFTLGLMSIAIPSEGRAMDQVEFCIWNASGGHTVTIADTAAATLEAHGIGTFGACSGS